MEQVFVQFQIQLVHLVHGVKVDIIFSFNFLQLPVRHVKRDEDFVIGVIYTRVIHRIVVVRRQL